METNAPVPTLTNVTELTDGMLPVELVAKLKATGQEFEAVKTRAGVAAIRKPTRQEYKRFMAQAGTDKVVAMENLAKSCCLHPGAAALDGWFEQYPAISGALANSALDLAGIDGDPEVKKY